VSSHPNHPSDGGPLQAARPSADLEELAR